MITKTALLATGAGALRAMDLTAKEKAILRKEYELDQHANLTLRNAGRGFLGAQLGSLGGGLIGGAVGGLPGATVGSLGGYIYGAKKLTDKYSKGNAANLLKKRKQNLSQE